MDKNNYIKGKKLLRKTNEPATEVLIKSSPNSNCVENISSKNGVENHDGGEKKT